MNKVYSSKVHQESQSGRVFVRIWFRHTSVFALWIGGSPIVLQHY